MRSPKFSAPLPISFPNRTSLHPFNQEGIVGCTPTPRNSYGKSPKILPYLSGYVWVIISPRIPRKHQINTMGHHEAHTRPYPLIHSKAPKSPSSGIRVRAEDFTGEPAAASSVSSWAGVFSGPQPKKERQKNNLYLYNTYVQIYRYICVYTCVCENMYEYICNVNANIYIY